MSSFRKKVEKAKSKLSIRTYKSPLAFVIMTMVMINLVILAVAAFVAMLFDSSFSSFIDAFANGSLKWMLTPNAILALDKPITLVIGVMVLITGMVLFTGTIIALTTNAIKDYFQKKKSGSGKIYLDNHIVVLNWNNKVPELVSDLYHMDAEDVTVMILADVNKDDAEKQILNAVRKEGRDKSKIKHMNVLVKSGDPMARSDLDDISIERARAILVMNPDDHKVVLKDMSKSDLAVIKVILGLGPIDCLYEPPIIVEIKHIETKAKIETLSRVVETLHEHLILPICFDMRLGQIIAQTLIEHRMEDIYLSLFSFEGSEIYYLKDQTFDDVLKHHAYAIPLAQTEEGIFVLSESHQTIGIRAPHPFKPIELKVRPIIEETSLTVSIIGKNNKLQSILDTFSAYQDIYHSAFDAKWIDDQDLVMLASDLNDAKGKRSVLLLSDESQSTDALDANVINNLIYLEGHVSNPGVTIIVELLNPKNDPIVKDFSIKNTIISNRIISLLLSKLALFKETAPFYENLLTIEKNDEGEDDQSVFVKPAKVLFDMTFPIAFESVKQFVESVYRSYGHAYMPFGVFKGKDLIIFEGNMHKETPLLINQDDEIVLMKL
ncbi:MAG: hypothetical protein K9K93_02190 [Acholeplasmataceae bacterium]|nr:hypothetical protein [Acholeplasmataceae bacterium]